MTIIVDSSVAAVRGEKFPVPFPVNGMVLDRKASRPLMHPARDIAIFEANLAKANV